ncbi:HD domain-containing phosphohydrolase [Acidithiobacillus sp.]|uniref:HD domain-containing phosphohydrolase n=1 Tax=Acidithiobacillus sp. TaxID=1872118 RepID=UPI003D00922E
MRSANQHSYLQNNWGAPPFRDRTRNARTKPFVVIVDDQSTGRKILERLVLDITPEVLVESFTDPHKALERIRDQTPDLILADYKMPIMDGLEFTKRVRAIPACGDVPLVIVTVVQDIQVRYKALEAGATDFLTRPVDQYECQARCRNLLALRKQQQIVKDRAKWLEDQVGLATGQVRGRERETLLILARAGEYRDHDTGNHVMRMAKYARVMAEKLGFTEIDCEEIELAAPLHDIGKIGIPDSILLKPGKLTEGEFQIMQAHPLIGHEILSDSQSRFIQIGAVIALGHHEKFDGSGYPKRLRGADIPLAARIVAVADVYDALTSARPYKAAWPFEEAIAYIRDQAGQHFDPLCVQAFLDQIDEIRAIGQRLRDPSPQGNTDSLPADADM